MEPVYTEDQWREIARVENNSTFNIPANASRKRAYAPHFAGGEFYLAWELRVDGSLNCWVFEAVSGVVVSYTDSRAFALEDARRVLALIPRERMAAIFAKGRERMASIEARAAITKAINKPKGRKAGKRARAVFEASGGQCHYCKCQLSLDGEWHIEHKMPRALFGGSEQSNLVAACIPCNMAKRDKTDVEFLALLAARA
jgi:5-methylcytosine-specific restriction endonuclease McrA